MPKRFQLREQPIIAFVATCDPVRARKFYAEVLGLPLVSEEMPFALVFDVQGIMLRVTIVQELTPAGYTVLGWCVPGIAQAAKALKEAGVQFERYPGMKQDELGVWTSPSGAKIAWFNDPDGNTLSISEH
jgi:catechol 2,3-dioxygenase-like lactoylglutathione lyase family enzyme